MLSLRNVRKSFGRVVAVDGLSLDIHRGEVFGLLGPNGAGKSTTLAMMVGLLAPDSGEIRVDGRAPTNNRARAGIGLAPQTLSIYDELSARENLDFFASLYGMNRRQRQARAAELLEFVGLSDRAKDRVRGFPGGMKRRINLAVALVHDPTLILLDEPTAGVDPQSRNAIFEIVTALRERGRTIIYITHYMEEVQRLCTRAGIIDHGQLLAIDSVESLIKAYGGQSIVRVERTGGYEEYLTDSALSVLTSVLATGDALSVHIDRPDLGSVFLNLTGRCLRD
ncbi:MAG: ABC transporter ATP-binding protein [Bacillota bacterium]